MNQTSHRHLLLRRTKANPGKNPQPLALPRCLTRGPKVLLNWDNKGCRDPYLCQIKEHLWGTHATGWPRALTSPRLLVHDQGPALVEQAHGHASTYWLTNLSGRVT